MERTPEQVTELAREIARALGSDWQAELIGADSDRNSRYLKRIGTAEQLLTRVGTNWAPSGMMHVAGSFPHANGQTYKPNGQNFTINVSESKTPAQIARDIERRLLARYREALAQALHAQARDDKAQRDAETLARQLAAVAGLREPWESSGGYWRVDVPGGTVSVPPQYSPEGSVRFERLTLTAEQARRVITVLYERPEV